MTKSIKRTLCVCGIAGVTVLVGMRASAEEKGAAATQQYDASAGLPGKIVAINKKAQKMTLNIKGKIYVFKIGPQIKIEKDGKQLRPAELAAGQEVNVITGLAQDGDMQIVAVKIKPSQSGSEAAGKKTTTQ